MKLPTLRQFIAVYSRRHSWARNPFRYEHGLRRLEAWARKQGLL